MALAGDIVTPARIDDGDGRRKLNSDLMVVEHDDVDAALLRPLKRIEAGRPAVDADDQRRAAIDQSVDRL